VCFGTAPAPGADGGHGANHATMSGSTTAAGYTAINAQFARFGRAIAYIPTHQSISAWVVNTQLFMIRNSALLGSRHHATTSVGKCLVPPCRAVGSLPTSTGDTRAPE